MHRLLVVTTFQTRKTPHAKPTDRKHDHLWSLAAGTQTVAESLTGQMGVSEGSDGARFDSGW
ncbi:MAG: hypothetical protein OXI90_07195 [Gammaproteobacteria bacterium]|nr:hypothetical protein [Gammaproteobacteria bacterium]